MSEEEREHEAGSLKSLRLKFPMLYGQTERSKEVVKGRGAAKKICRALRQYYRREAWRAQLRWTEVALWLLTRCATVAASAARGRLGRRRVKTLRHINVLREASEALLSTVVVGKKKTWYTKPEQLRRFDADYLELLGRRAFTPPRFVLEAAIADASSRVTALRDRLTTLAQARWRGLTVRRFFVLFLQEKHRQRQIRASAAFRITSLARSALVLKQYKDLSFIHARRRRKT